MIKGGYYIKARKIQESEIAHAPPFVRELWDWLLREVNHKSNHVCERGETVRRYKDILDGLCWYAGYRKMSYSVHDCENGLKWLTKRNMITTAKTTRGMIIKVDKYDFYQDPKNYESQTESRNEARVKPQSSHTINKNEKKEKKDTYSEQSSQEKFILEEALQKLDESPRRDLNIISLYWRRAGLKFPSKNASLDNLKMCLKHIKQSDLGSYDNKKLLDTMQYLGKQDYAWNLATVGKFITRDLTKLK